MPTKPKSLSIDQCLYLLQPVTGEQGLVNGPRQALEQINAIDTIVDGVTEQSPVVVIETILDTLLRLHESRVMAFGSAKASLASKDIYVKSLQRYRRGAKAPQAFDVNTELDVAQMRLDHLQDQMRVLEIHHENVITSLEQHISTLKAHLRAYADAQSSGASAP